jgi:hypothetical protein
LRTPYAMWCSRMAPITRSVCVTVEVTSHDRAVGQAVQVRRHCYP